MDDEEVLRLVRDTLCAIAPDGRQRFQRLTLSSELGQIGVDSLQIVEMIGRLEDMLALTFDERELAKLQSIADIVTLIRGGRLPSRRLITE